MKKFLEIKDLTFSHEEGSQILNNANLDIGMGDFISILGPSGSGKTTLLRLIAGLDMQDNGSIIIENKIIADKEVMTPPERRNIGLVVQDKALVRLSSFFYIVLSLQVNSQSVLYVFAVMALH